MKHDFYNELQEKLNELKEQELESYGWHLVWSVLKWITKHSIHGNQTQRSERVAVSSRRYGGTFLWSLWSEWGNLLDMCWISCSSKTTWGQRSDKVWRFFIGKTKLRFDYINTGKNFSAIF